MAWQRAAELLEQREYEQVARLLQEKQEAVQLSGQMNLVILLAAACQLCLACRQFQVDRELHQLGLDKARRREKETRQQIQAVLTMLSQLAPLEAQPDLETISDPPPSRLAAEASEATGSGESSSLLQRIRQLLGFEPAAPQTVVESFGDPDRHAVDSPTLIDHTPLPEHSAQIIAGASDEVEAPELSDSPADARTAAEETSESSDSSTSAQTIEEEENSKLSVSSVSALTTEENEVSESNDGSADRHTAENEEKPELSDDSATQQKAERDEDPVLSGRSASAHPTMPTSPALSPTITRRQHPTTVDSRESDGPSLVVYCLGPFRVYQNDQLITSWSGLKGLSILKYLIANEGKSVAKEILMDVFWPDMDIEATRRNLHQAIYSLRQTLRYEYPNFQHLLFRNDRYELNPEIDLWIDFVEFEHHVRAGKRSEFDGNIVAANAEYGIAEGLFQGDFLSEDIYESWPLAQRERLRTTYLEVADRLSAYYQRREEHTATIAICQKILAHDNCYETAHRRLMESYLAYGQRHLAIRQYETCFNALAKELDLGPSEETIELYNIIKMN